MGRRPRRERAGDRDGRRRRRWLAPAAVAAVLLAAAGLGSLTGMALAAWRTLPALTGAAPRLNLSSEIYDADGKPVTRVYDVENREPVTLAEVPQHVVDAFVAVEDERFWRHRGVDLIAVARALVNDLLGRQLQGASTITQQLARNAFPIGRERTLRRKIQEAFLALELERRFTKREILEMYLNHIFFGRDVYGLQMAARTYFGKPAKDLTVAEGALLAGLPQAPNAYEPISHPEAARARRNQVLDLMAAKGYLTKAQAEEAKATPVRTVPAPARRGEYPAPHFVDFVLTQLLRRFPPEQVYRGGLKVYTTLRPEVQQAAEEAVRRHLDPQKLPRGKELPQAAVVVLDQQTGAIVAMVGGRTHEKMLELNRAWYDPVAGCCRRQPGSAFKPLAVYLPALAAGMTPATVFEDALKSWPTPQGEWRPENYDRKYYGPTTIREAVRRSVNTVAVRVMEAVGVDAGLDMAERLGIGTLVRTGPRNDRNLATALGGLTYGVSVLDMARAYAAIANGGQRVEPFAIRRVEDADGNVLLENRPRRARVVDEQHAYLMLDVLRSAVEPYPGGWLRDAALGAGARVPALDAAGRQTGIWPTAGKTGTTTENKDIWFVGFTPRYTGAVWIGYDNPERSDPLPRTFLSSYQPTWIFRDTMAAAHRGLTPSDFPRPEGLMTAEVAINSGLLPGPATPPQYVRRELFIAGTEPQAVDDTWVRVTVCKEQPDRLYLPGCACTPDERSFPRDPLPGEAYPIPFPPDVPRAPALACDGSAAPPAGGGPPGAPEETGAPGGAVARGSLRLVVGGGRVDPAQVTLRQGARVELVLYGLGTAHRLVSPELGLAVAVPAEGTARVTLAAPAPGTYPVRCADHPEEVLQVTVIP